jgi:integrase
LPDGSRKVLYGKTQREVRAKATKTREDLENGLDPKAETVTIQTFLTRWLADTASQRVRPSTLASYTGHVTNHLVPCLGRHRVRDLSPQHVNAMMTSIVEAGRSPATANLVRATLRTALASAMKWGIVSRNVAQLADPRTRDAKRIAPLTLDETRRFLFATKDDRLGSLFAVAIATGCRQGELLGLQWDAVDLEAGTLTVRHTLTRHNDEWSFSPPKTDQSRRIVPLTATAKAALRRQRTRNLEAQLAAGERWAGDRYSLVFPSTLGTPLDSRNVTSHLQRLLARHELPRQRFHDLRHLTATLLLAEGVDLFTVKEILGHSQISLTANTYGHLTRKVAEDAAARLDRALGDSLSG